MNEVCNKFILGAQKYIITYSLVPTLVGALLLNVVMCGVVLEVAGVRKVSCLHFVCP